MFLFNDFFPSKIIAFVSNRDIDFSFDQKFSAVQQDYLSAQLGGAAENLVNIKQVHGSAIVEVEANPSETFEADGIITQTPGLPIAVRTADCLPVFIFDPHKNVIGLIHVGWRGAKAHIIIKAVESLKQKRGSDPKNLRIAFGPCIRSRHYQVGEELKGLFPAETYEKEDGFYLDLPLVVRGQLLSAGAEDHNIYDPKVCTYCEEHLFSFRQEGENAGRMLSVMMIKEK